VLAAIWSIGGQEQGIWLGGVLWYTRSQLAKSGVFSSGDSRQWVAGSNGCMVVHVTCLSSTLKRAVEGVMWQGASCWGGMIEAGEWDVEGWQG